MELFELTDDALYHIFDRLTFNEQLVITQVCGRFRDIIVDLNWRSKHFNELHTNHEDLFDLPQPECLIFFGAIANVLEKFTILNNLQGYFPDPIGVDELIFYGNIELPRLRIFECQRERIGDVHIGNFARNWRGLEVLRIRSEYVTGCHIIEMSNLRRLYLAKCPLSLHHLTNILSGDQLLQLTHLDVSGHPDPDLVKEALLAAKDGPLRLQHFVISWNAVGSEFVQFMENKMRDLRILRLIGPFIHYVHRLLARTMRISNFKWLAWLEDHTPRIEELRFYNFAMRQEVQFPFDQRHFQSMTSLHTFHCNYELLFSIDPELYTNRTLRDLHLNYLEDIRNLLEVIKMSPVLEHIYISRLLQIWPDVLHLTRAIISRLQAQRTRRVPLTIHCPRITEELFQSEYYIQQNVLVLKVERVIEEPAEKPFVEMQFIIDEFGDDNDGADSDSGI